MEKWECLGKKVLGFTNEQLKNKLNYLSIEYFSFVSFYVYHVTGINEVEDNIRFTKMMIELFTIEEFNNLIRNTDCHHDWKNVLMSSVFYQDPSNAALKEVKSIVLHRLKKRIPVLSVKQLATC